MKTVYYWLYIAFIGLLCYFSSFCYFIIIPTIVALIIRLIMDLTKLIYEHENPKDTSPYKYSYEFFKGWGFVFAALVLTIPCFFVVSDFYNKTIVMQANYMQKSQEKSGFYDKLYKSYTQKTDIATVNKDAFIEVSKIIMENRKDGEQLSWKWVRENQQIPYSEFTYFYKDLSNYIETQRDQYFAIEKQCQVLAKDFNIYISTFPNLLYAKILGIKSIEFEYGFLSDHTNSVFKSKIENVE